MKTNTAKTAMKIAPKNHNEFLQVWDLLMEMGYHSELAPTTCPYLFCHEDGHIGFEFFDLKGADLNSPHSSFQYFKNHRFKEVSLAELMRQPV